MNSLVVIVDGEPRTSTELIAAGTNVEHRAVIQLVRAYNTDLEEFGRVTFEMRMVNRPQGGGQPITIALLNQEQATLIMTYMRNSKTVRTFKKNLVKAFFELARQQQQSRPGYLERLPQSLPDALRLAADSIELQAEHPERETGFFVHMLKSYIAAEYHGQNKAGLSREPHKRFTPYHDKAETLNPLKSAVLSRMANIETWETTVRDAWNSLFNMAYPDKSKPRHDTTFPGKPQDMRRYLSRIKVTLSDNGISYCFLPRHHYGVPIVFQKSVIQPEEQTSSPTNNIKEANKW